MSRAKWWYNFFLFLISTLVFALIAYALSEDHYGVGIRKIVSERNRNINVACVVIYSMMYIFLYIRPSHRRLKYIGLPVVVAYINITTLIVFTILAFFRIKNSDLAATLLYVSLGINVLLCGLYDPSYFNFIKNNINNFNYIKRLSVILFIVLGISAIAWSPCKVSYTGYKDTTGRKVSYDEYYKRHPIWDLKSIDQREIEAQVPFLHYEFKSRHTGKAVAKIDYTRLIVECSVIAFLSLLFRRFFSRKL